MSDIAAVTYDQAKAVTKSDTVVDPAGPFAAILVCSAGDVKLTSANGVVVTITAPPVGTIIPLLTRMVWSTGTSSAVVGLSAMPYQGARNYA